MQKCQGNQVEATEQIDAFETVLIRSNIITCNKFDHLGFKSNTQTFDPLILHMAMVVRFLEA